MTVYGNPTRPPGAHRKTRWWEHGINWFLYHWSPQ